MKISNYKLKITVVGLLLITIFFVRPAIAIDPSLPNNKYGIHLAQPEEADLEGASELVNSEGGKWGYVTLVIQDNDRDPEKWQRIMDELRSLRLIPIIRIATHPEGASWKKPSKEDHRDWVNFLSALNWVVRDRYVILFNEVNHGAEWGGVADPTDYAQVAYEFARALKASNKDYFVMLAGLDASAPQSPPNFIDEATFLSQIYSAKPELFTEDLISGLSSHSYPNPGFAGSPYGVGRGSVRSYEWELDYLRSLGVSKNLPVFITETGWTSSAFSHLTIGEFFKVAYENVWLPDSRVRAVTPFILSYQGEPFLQFSWKKLTGAGSEFSPQNEQDELYYDHFYSVKSLKKTVGEPDQIQRGRLVPKLPARIVLSSTYNFRVKLKNSGQAIWDKQDGYELKFTNGEKEYFFGSLTDVKPQEEVEIPLFFKTSEREGANKSTVVLTKNGKKILESAAWKYEVVAPPSLTFGVSLFPRLREDPGRTYEIQIFDDAGTLVFKKSGLRTRGGRATIEKVPNVYLDKRFRVVVLSRNYLPRQLFVSLKKGDNKVQFASMVPLDFSADGALGWSDLGALVLNPKLLGLFLP